MSELKTLKELENSRGDDIGALFSTRFTVNRTGNKLTKEESIAFTKGYKQGKRVVFHDSRQEAIKWIKDFDKQLNRLGMIPVSANQILTVRNWIKHFFNITDEDLE